MTDAKDSGPVVEAQAQDAVITDAAAAKTGRPYIGILFECCGAYMRVYRHPGRPEYRARCPRCLRPVRLRVDKDGTDARLFRAS